MKQFFYCALMVTFFSPSLAFSAGDAAPGQFVLIVFGFVILAIYPLISSRFFMGKGKNQFKRYKTALFVTYASIVVVNMILIPLSVIFVSGSGIESSVLFSVIFSVIIPLFVTMVWLTDNNDKSR
ncbi:hypothetical protein [Zooshikella sp. RANM57]|uniref:hypothetical protein n=1 Tax=Zooshikella sp. RANM57 TaxID=3425863 RepID=UPI003D6EF96D